MRAMITKFITVLKNDGDEKKISKTYYLNIKKQNEIITNNNTIIIIMVIIIKRRGGNLSCDGTR